MPKVCPNCLYSNNDANTKCDVCGQNLATDLPGNPTSNVSNANVIRGLTLLRNGYLIFILEFVFGIALSYILLRTLNITTLFGPFGTISSASSLSSLSSTAVYIVITLVIEVTISIAGYLMIYYGLRTLSHLRPNIRTGATGALLLMIGLIIVLTTAVPALSVAASASTVTNTSSSSFLSVTTHDIGGLILVLLLLVVGVVLLLVGIIMLTIGVFRVGRAFSSGTVEAGAILAIFPSIIGYIILILGLNGIIRRVRNSPQNKTEM